MRYLTTDVVTVELRPTGSEPWFHYSVTHVMRDGARFPASPVNTVRQAETRTADFHPHATVRVITHHPTIDALAA